MAQWKKGFDLDFMANELESWIVRDGSQTETSIKISGLGFSRELLLLTGMVQFDNQVPESVARKIVSQSVTSCSYKGVLSSKDLLSEVRRREKRFLERPVEKFRLYTSLSVSRSTKIKRIYVSGSYITVGGRVSFAVKNSRENLFDKICDSVLGDYPDRYQPVAVSISAKTPELAAQIALDRLNFIRGLWNIQINRGSFRESFQRPEPINKIVLGPMHTVHRPDGALVGNQFWYDNSYQGPVSVFDEPERAEYFEKYAREVLQIDKTHAYSAELRKAVCRYVEVLDGRDMNAVVLGLWGILELLTDTQRKNYDVLIDRASFVYDDHKKAKHILQLIRLRRNEYAHDGSTSSGAEVLAHQLKQFVETLIGFHFGLAERHQFVDMKEFARMLDLPAVRDRHERTIQLAQLAFEVRYGS